MILITAFGVAPASASSARVMARYTGGPLTDFPVLGSFTLARPFAIPSLSAKRSEPNVEDEIRGWRFQPAVCQGKPVAVRVGVTYPAGIIYPGWDASSAQAIEKVNTRTEGTQQ